MGRGLSGTARRALSVDRSLRSIASDRREGASRLAGRALVAIVSALERQRGGRAADVRRAALRTASELRRTQPAMGLFGVWARQWEEIVGRSSSRSPRTALVQWARQWQRRLDREPGGIARTVRRRMPPGSRVVTISRGATVTAALSSLRGTRRPREVVVLESLPGGEGRRLVRDLRRCGMNARWVPDRSAARAVRSADLVLIGADAVEPDGAVVNKVGTRRLASEARRAGVPVVVVAARSKQVGRGSGGRRLPYLFDRTPARLISEYWTDGGVRRVPRPRARRTPQRP